MLVQLLLLPVYLGLFLGGAFVEVIDPAPFIAASFLYLLLPLAGAALTERQALHRPAVARWAQVMAWVPVPALAVTLFLVVATQLPRVAGNVEVIAGLVPVYALYLAGAALLGVASARLLRLQVQEGGGRDIRGCQGARQLHRRGPSVESFHCLLVEYCEGMLRHPCPFYVLPLRRHCVVTTFSMRCNAG